METAELINEINDDKMSSKIEQYKLYVELMDKISERRVAANNYFVGLNTLVLTVIGLDKFDCSKYWLLITVLGIVISLTWDYMLKSYKLLNTGKCKVIHEMEKELSFNCYAYEWEILGKGEDRKKYLPISTIEKIVPKIFVAIYFMLGIINIF